MWFNSLISFLFFKLVKAFGNNMRLNNCFRLSTKFTNSSHGYALYCINVFIKFILLYKIYLIVLGIIIPNHDPLKFPVREQGPEMGIISSLKYYSKTRIDKNRRRAPSDVHPISQQKGTPYRVSF